MSEVIVSDCCPRCKSEQVFEYEPGKWRLFIARTDNEIAFCPKCGHGLAWSVAEVEQDVKLRIEPNSTHIVRATFVYRGTKRVYVDLSGREIETAGFPPHVDMAGDTGGHG